MKKSFLYVISCFMCTLVSTSIVFAQKIDNLVALKQQSKNELFHKLKKAPHTPAFESEGYWVWGSSVVKGEDGKYHMFVSRFPKSLPFHPGWMVASEIVHAISDTPQGPYRFSDVALPARGAQYWDGRSTHNPRILKYKGKYYFSYSTGDTHLLCYAVGDNPYGPFTYQGVILTPVVGWTTHHSIAEYKGKWYLFHHDCVPSGGKTWLRSLKVVELEYDEEGKIQTIKGSADE